MWREFEPYNPLDRDQLAESVRRRLESQPREPLPPAHFLGGGLYALYYTGPFVAYQRLADTDLPIYIGRSAPSATRMGAERDTSKKLFRRLREHAKSVQQVGNLDLDDFACRFLVVEDPWIPLGEYALLREYHPVLWNTVVDGFGSHAQGRGRDEGERSKWDTLHPGRPGPMKLYENRLGAAAIGRLADEALAARERGDHADFEVVEE